MSVMRTHSRMIAVLNDAGQRLNDALQGEDRATICSTFNYSRGKNANSQ